MNVYNIDQINKVKKFSFGDMLLGLLLFLTTMDFQGMFFYLALVTFACWMLFCKGTLHVDFSFFLLLLLAASIYIFDTDTTKSASYLIRLFLFPICYLMGSCFFSGKHAYEVGQYAEKTIMRILTILSMGFLVHGALNFFLNLGSSSRNILDIWAGTTMNATRQAMIVCLPVAFSVALLFTHGKLISKLGALAMLVLAFAYNLLLAGRTIVFLILLCAAICIIQTLVNRKQSIKTKITLVLILFGVLCIVIALYQADALGIRSYVEDSNLYKRLFDQDLTEMASDSRLESKLAYIQYMPQYLWGGGYIFQRVGSYAHDIFLDTYDDAGVFALLAIGIYVILAITRLLKCIFNEKISAGFKQVISCTYASFLTVFMLEPILLGHHWFLIVFCLIDGLVSGLLRQQRLVPVK